MAWNSAQGNAGTAGPKITLKNNGVTMDCLFAKNGKLCQKIEHHNGNNIWSDYLFDDAGRLLKVSSGGMFTEEYTYDSAGRREKQWRDRGFSNLTDGYMYYDEHGRLERAGDTFFAYDAKGALASSRNSQGVIHYVYGQDTMLDEVVFSAQEKIRYEYDPCNPLILRRRFENGKLSVEYEWFNPLHLSRYLDHEHRLVYSFAYAKSGVADKVRITPMQPAPKDGEQDFWSDTTDWLEAMVERQRTQRLHELIQKHGGKLDLFCGCDQVGTLTLLTDASGAVIKETLRDSFGVWRADSFPELFMPIGFGGGLQDPDTGLVHFGYRDYDPNVGRFTAPDPLGDTGGDHDLYEYCVDDPITMRDPTGLLPFLPFLIGKGLSLLLGLGGAYGAAKLVDAAKSKRDGNESTAARDAVKGVAPKTAAIQGISALPGTTMMAPGAIRMVSGAADEAVLKAGEALMNSKHGSTILTGAKHTGQFAEPFVVPGLPSSISIPGAAGGMINEIYRIYQENKK